MGEIEEMSQVGAGSDTMYLQPLQQSYAVEVFSWWQDDIVRRYALPKVAWSVCIFIRLDDNEVTVRMHAIHHEGRTSTIHATGECLPINPQPRSRSALHQRNVAQVGLQA